MLHSKGLRPYYSNAEHIAKTLKMLAYNSYKPDLHDEIVKKLASHAESLAPVNGQSAANSIAEAYGEDLRGEGGTFDISVPQTPPEPELSEETGEISPLPTTSPQNALETVAARDLQAIETVGDLFIACYEDFQMYKDAVLKEAGVSRTEDLVDHPRAIYQQIAAVRS